MNIRGLHIATSCSIHSVISYFAESGSSQHLVRPGISHIVVSRTLRYLLSCGISHLWISRKLWRKEHKQVEKATVHMMIINKLKHI